MAKKILIVGAGFTGLSAAWYLNQAGYSVVVIEKTDQVGGLAGGWREKNWQWYLDKHYHHVFSSDKILKKFLKELGLIKQLFFKKPTTAFWVNNQAEGLFNSLTPRSLLTLGQLKLTHRWQKLETKTASQWLKKRLGKHNFNTYWQPLFSGKFGRYQDQISLAWFWARIKARTFSLGYYSGGFQQLAEAIVKQLKIRGVKFYFDQEVKQITPGFKIRTQKQSFKAEKLLLTTPLPTVLKLVPSLPRTWQKIKFLHCLTLVLQTNKPILKDIYWLNVSDSRFPFISLVEQTNFIPAEKYGGQHLLYVGKYLTENQPLWSMTKTEIIKLYLPYIKKIKPEFRRGWIKKAWLFKNKYAQPVVTPGYSQLKPTIKTPIKNLYLANQAHIYPWDRGLNYAIGLGKQAADITK
ncbi:FAD-dependent oxidoreductase [Patescibacteria group bacterium]|nr:FAD-dependent oxidoreductase [Patescibacteria group bacterium]MBU1931643.1 FAD-dependent oxidoreductase [Patescibacteria group bacterium]